MRNKNVEGVGPLLAQLREDKTAVLINAGAAEGDGMEEGEEPTFTHAEETKRALRREERKKKRTEDFKAAKETCTQLSPVLLSSANLLSIQTSPQTTQKP